MVEPRRCDAMVIGLLILTGLAWPAGSPGPAGASRPDPMVDRYGDPLPAGAVLRLGTVKYRQDSPIQQIAYSPDGRYFVTDGEDCILRIWDAKAGRVIRRIDPGVGVLDDFALTSDGKLVMSLGTTFELGKSFVQNVTLTDVETGDLKVQKSWPVENPARQVLALCPDRRLIGAGIDRKGVRVLDARDGSEVCRLAIGDRTIERLQFSRDGRWLGVWTAGDEARRGEVELRLYDVAGKRELRVIRQPGFLVSDFAFSPDGSRIATAVGGPLSLWDVATGERTTFEDSRVDLLAFSADGKTLVGYTRSGWVNSGKPPKRWVEQSLALDGSRSGTISVFDPAARKRVSAFHATNPDQTKVVLSPGGRTLLGIGNLVPGGGEFHSRRARVRAWDLEQGRERWTPTDGHVEPIRTLVFTPDQKTLITGSKDGVLQFWDLGNGTVSSSLQSRHPPVEFAALSPAGRWLVAAPAIEPAVCVWDLTTRREPAIVTYPRRPYKGPLAVRFTDEHTVLLVNPDAKPYNIDVESRRVTPGAELHLSRSNPTEQRLRELVPQMAGLDAPAHGDFRLVAAAFSPDGKLLAGLGTFSGLHVVEIGTGKEIVHTDGGELLRFSLNGGLLAIATSRDKAEPKRDDRIFARRKAAFHLDRWASTIQLIVPETGRQLRQFDVESDWIWAMAFSPNGQTLAVTSGWDVGHIHLFRVRNGEEIRRITSPPFRSPALAFTPDGSRLVSGMADGSVLVWDVRSNAAGP